MQTYTRACTLALFLLHLRVCVREREREREREKKRGRTHAIIKGAKGLMCMCVNTQMHDIATSVF